MISLDETIELFEKKAEEKRINAYMHEDMMVYKQSIKCNTQAKYYKETMNEYIELANEFQQLANWLKELKLLREQKCEDAISRQAVLGLVNADGAKIVLTSAESEPQESRTVTWIDEIYKDVTKKNLEEIKKLADSEE